jgi:hypothetical protein
VRNLRDSECHRSRQGSCEYRAYCNSRFRFEYSESFFHPTMHQHITNQLKHQRAWYRQKWHYFAC